MDKVVHFRIPVDDFERAQEFYTRLFDWQIFKVPGTDYYYLFTVETGSDNCPKEVGAINGTMVKRQSLGELPVFLVRVPSLDEYLKKVETIGGRVVTQKEIVGTYGYLAMIADSEGNVIGLWEDLTATQP